MEIKSPFESKGLCLLGSKVNTNDLPQLRRPYKSLKPQWCILCKEDIEFVDHLFLHCSLIIGLWHKLFNLVNMMWASPRSIEEMFIIAFKGLGISTRGKT